jgi:hypothetical protein
LLMVISTPSNEMWLFPQLFCTSVVSSHEPCRPSQPHILRHARLSDFEIELQQFAVDTRSAPQRIVDAHLSDQRAQFRIDWWPTTSRSGLPTPVTTRFNAWPMLSTNPGVRGKVLIAAFETSRTGSNNSHGGTLISSARRTLQPTRSGELDP